MHPAGASRQTGIRRKEQAQVFVALPACCLGCSPPAGPPPPLGIKIELYSSPEGPTDFLCLDRHMLSCSLLHLMAL